MEHKQNYEPQEALEYLEKLLASASGWALPKPHYWEQGFWLKDVALIARFLEQAGKTFNLPGYAQVFPIFKTKKQLKRGRVSIRWESQGTECRSITFTFTGGYSGGCALVEITVKTGTQKRSSFITSIFGSSHPCALTQNANVKQRSVYVPPHWKACALMHNANVKKAAKP